MIVAFAGLPATGKSTLANALGQALPAPVLNKDLVRERLFPAGWLDYSAEQDDFVVGVLLQTARFYLSSGRAAAVILDGRTFRKASLRKELTDAARAMGQPLRWIECVCAEHEIRRRLEGDAGRHPAGNRDFDLYERVRREAEPMTEPRLVLDTTVAAVSEQVEEIRQFLRR